MNTRLPEHSPSAWGVGARWNLFGFTRAFELQLGVLMGLCLAMLAGQAVFTLVLTLVGSAEPAGRASGWNPAWNRFHALMVALCVAPLPFLLDGSMDTERLWLRRVTPLGVWRRNRSGLWSFGALVLAIALLPLVVLALIAPSPAGTGSGLLWTLTWFTAWLGSLGCLSALWRSASTGGKEGMGNRLFTVPVLMVVLVMWIAVTQALLATEHWTAWLEGLGWRGWSRWALLIFGGAGCVVWFLARQTRDGTHGTSDLDGTGHQGWRARIDAVAAYLFAQTRSIGPAGSTIAVVVGTQFNTWLTPLENGQFKNFPTVGSELSYVALYMLLMLTMLASSLLAGASLHWRDVLAPGRGRRLSWGWSVAAWTWVRLVLLLMLWLAVLAVLKLVFPDFIGGRSSFGDWLGAVGAWLPVLLVDLALASCLAAALVPWSLKHSGAGPLVIMAFAVAAVQLVLWRTFDAANPVLIRRDGMWLFVMGAACAVLLGVARHRWARVDLSQLRRQRVRDEGETPL